MNKSISFCLHRIGTYGPYLTHLDLQQYLHDESGYKINFYCDVRKLLKVIKNSRRPYKFDSCSIKLFTNNIQEKDIMITDFSSFINLYNDKVKITCKKLIVIDTFELTYHLKNISSECFCAEFDLEKIVNSFQLNEILFLMPPSNHTLFKKRYSSIPSKIFYKQINIDMLSKIRFSNHTGNLYRWDYEEDRSKEAKTKFGKDCYKFDPYWIYDNNCQNRIFDRHDEIDYLFEFKNLVYSRRKYFNHIEQFGRLIFEYILLDKTVYFLDDPIYCNDGLADYLKHYDIQFENSKIVTTKKQLKEKICSYEDQPWEY
jgi:hypothetical protein